MGELWFVGLGLGDERDLGARAIALLSTCERLFFEGYTSVYPAGARERLASLVDRPIETLGREEVEAERPVLEALAQAKRVAFLVVGDPFAATTHVALRLAAERAGHRWFYLPNASVLTAAAGLLGLMPYRFGRVVSLPLPEPGFVPTSPLAEIERNRSIGAHTLVLLDLRPGEERYLTADAAVRLLLERGGPDGAVQRSTELAVVARVGREGAGAWYDEAGRLAERDFGAPPHAVVVPAPNLHFVEREALERWRRSS